MSLKRIKPFPRSDVEIAEERRLRELFQDRPTVEALIGSGEIDADRITTGTVEESLLKTLGALQTARQSRGLSLTEIDNRSGIDLASLSRLEAGKNPNPTFETLCRYAAAIGLRLEISLVENEDPVLAPAYASPWCVNRSHGSAMGVRCPWEFFAVDRTRQITTIRGNFARSDESKRSKGNDAQRAARELGSRPHRQAGANRCPGR